MSVIVKRKKLFVIYYDYLKLTSLLSGDLICRNGAILSVKHESIGQSLEAATAVSLKWIQKAKYFPIADQDVDQHEELSSEECAKLLGRLPQMEEIKSTSTIASVPLPVVDNVLRNESAPLPKDVKSEKPVKVTHLFSNYGVGNQILSFEFNQPMQTSDVHVNSKPELPEGQVGFILLYVVLILTISNSGNG